MSEILRDDDRYVVSQYFSFDDICQFINQEKHHLDCLILQSTSSLEKLVSWLYGQAILLPAIIISDESDADNRQPIEESSSDVFRYHTAEVNIRSSELKDIGKYIDQAIAQFINLSPTTWVKPNIASPKAQDIASPIDLLLPQQQRLTEKLKERLGYLGVYYKRDPQNFFRHLSPERKQELLNTLKTTYREIVLCYFSDDGTLNQRIDDFVNTVFFTDVSAAQVVEIHMELIDEFSKQLKLEGRSEEILLDYRLTLIDTIAHLCEMYRRSIPREA